MLGESTVSVREVQVLSLSDSLLHPGWSFDQGWPFNKLILIKGDIVHGFVELLLCELSMDTKVEV